MTGRVPQITPMGAERIGHKDAKEHKKEIPNQPSLILVIH